jgi:hypothetical protein
MLGCGFNPRGVNMSGKKAALMPLGMGAGIGIGAGIGAATDNLALWLSLGVAIGAGLGVALSGLSGAKRDGKDDEGD